MELTLWKDSLRRVLIVTDWSKVDENVIFCWDQVFSTKATFENLRHLIRVIRLRSEVEIIILASRLDNDDDIIVEAIVFRDQVGVSSEFF